MPHHTRPPGPHSGFRRSIAQRALLAAIVSIAALACIRAHAASGAADPSSLRELSAAALRSPQERGLADFAGVTVSPDVRQLANWSFFTGDNEGHSIVVLDKKAASAYVFNPAGRLIAHAPVLLGLAVGDDAAPGIGDKPLAAIRDGEKTTPAGRFVARPGKGSAGEDIVWIDYEGALAMHRVVTNVPSERRGERLASPDPRQRRISFGCINLTPSFYDQVLTPAVKRTGAIVYVLPESKTPQEVFGSWDVTDLAADAPGVPDVSAVVVPTRASSTEPGRAFVPAGFAESVRRR